MHDLEKLRGSQRTQNRLRNEVYVLTTNFTFLHLFHIHPSPTQAALLRSENSAADCTSLASQICFVRARTIIARAEWKNTSGVFGQVLCVEGTVIIL